ncbi:hypothetical protein E3O19_13810 [Cryobacterium algoritolerans]|uniref:Acyltransferase n=1 Tax=Cryobacterium algoritolerans TaxID=1259184 RepID=A0A4R8WL04_9MICO|nr:hypothetical protein [Cryobacterium algoritolerans]TFC12024.1 hypothetical protein E3O19_13810 [Cryobacterium algoritolerans]
MTSVPSLLLGLLPASRVKNWMLNRAGHSIHKSAMIGPILVVGATRLDISEGARIGPFNVFRNVNELRLGPFSEIGQWNWVSAAPFLVEAQQVETAGVLRVGGHSAITSRHYFDVSGGVIVGAFSTIAGVRSVFMTHGIDVVDGVLDTKSIEIGEYAMVGGSCSLVLGARVPPYSVVAMGSVVIAGLTESHALYAGAPAKFKKRLDAGVYANRERGPVQPRRPKL